MRIPLWVFLKDIGSHRGLSVKTSSRRYHVQVKYSTVDQKPCAISVVKSFNIA